MKNFLARLGLPRKASEAQITDALADALHGSADEQSLLDAETILSERVSRAYYERTHLQYAAIHASLDCLKATDAVDSHQWRERLVEFDTQTEDETL